MSGTMEMDTGRVVLSPLMWIDDPNIMALNLLTPAGFYDADAGTYEGVVASCNEDEDEFSFVKCSTGEENNETGTAQRAFLLSCGWGRCGTVKFQSLGPPPRQLYTNVQLRYPGLNTQIIFLSHFANFSCLFQRN